LRGMLALMVQHHPHRSGADLTRIWQCSLRLGSTFSRIGASGKPGAGHTPCFCSTVPNDKPGGTCSLLPTQASRPFKIARTSSNRSRILRRPCE
jgi:hypothetical protein